MTNYRIMLGGSTPVIVTPSRSVARRGISMSCEVRPLGAAWGQIALSIHIPIRSEVYAGGRVVRGDGNRRGVDETPDHLVFEGPSANACWAAPSSFSPGAPITATSHSRSRIPVLPWAVTLCHARSSIQERRGFSKYLASHLCRESE
jgi:hypothetical protein